MIQVNDLFEVNYGVALEYYKMEPDKNGVPFISRQSKNNGMIGRVKPIREIPLNPANTISVSCGGSVLESFLQEEPYYTAFHVLYLSPRVEMTKKLLLFYCLVIKSNKFRYNYGRQANKTLASIFIPSLEEVPSWVGKFIIPNKPTNKSFLNQKLQLQSRDWKWFRYIKIFRIEKGKRLTKANMVKGNIPFIGAIDSNNGYREFISKRPIHEADTITVNYNGSVAEAFYQPRPFWASDDCNVLYHKKINQYVGMFLATIIKQEKYRFNYGRKWHKDRMENSKIKLPVNKQGKPDWQFMENFIKGLPFSKNLEESFSNN